MPPIDLRSRQIHLDFHTSSDIPGVGSQFDPEVFADTLANAHVNSVTAFARCHHGHVYYDSKVHPERIHPTLTNRNMLREQIEACHRRGIRVPIYTTVQYDQFTADAHRDWLCINEHGIEYDTTPLQPGFGRYLDVLHPGYRQFLKDHVTELFELLPVDGLFFDIVTPRWSLARHWIQAMDEAGLDPENPQARVEMGIRVTNDWMLEMTRFIEGLPQYDPQRCTIFYNAGHVGPGHRATRSAFSHYEIESLPSGGWGYMHYPMAVRYGRELGKPCVGMTGKFHSTWGDFHSYKNKAALEYECFRMLAMGTACSIGDQLHPTGRIDPATYRLIGGVYAGVQAKEPWCRNAVAVKEIGVLTPEEFEGRATFAPPAGEKSKSAMGAARMLQELGRQFDIISSDCDFACYKLLVLPDQIPVDDALAGKLRDYLAAGGSVLASWKSGLDAREAKFQFEGLGIRVTGDAPFSPDFLVPGERFCAGLEPTAYVMYEQGVALEVARQAEMLAEVQPPYFNRTYRHFCSHLHAPSTGRSAYPGVVRAGSYLHFMHPIYRQYQLNAPRWCRVLLGNAINLLIGRATVEVQGPTAIVNTLNRQANPARHVLHLLHYVPERRGECFDVIEDVIPLHETAVSIALDHRPSTVRLVPEDAALPFDYTDGRVTFIVPRIDGHAMVEIT